MTENDQPIFGDDVYASGVEDADDLDPIDTLDSEDSEELADTGYSPPDFRPTATRYGTTEFEQAAGAPLDRRLSEEEPDIWGATSGANDPYPTDSESDGDLAEVRAGRLVGPEDPERSDLASDVGFAGYAASGEEAAMHIIDDDPSPTDRELEEPITE
jgi:hypothetical protein